MKKILIAALLLLATVFTAPYALAAEDDPAWLRLPDSMMSVRKADIYAGRSTDTAARLWIRFDFSRDARTPFRSGLQLIVVNCVAQTYRKMTTTFYAPNGETVKGPTDYQTHFILPDSNLSVATDMLCADPGDDTQVDYR